MERTPQEILQRHLPQAAVAPFLDYWERNKLNLHICRERTSKLGDYLLPTPQHPQHAISVNGTLNRYHFLLVLLHEMGHLDTFVRYGRSVQPHGHEWQEAFARLIREYLDYGCFPDEVAALLNRYAAKIPLNRTLKEQIDDLLAHYDRNYNPDDSLKLDNLLPGDRFVLKNGKERVFEVVEHRRSRWVCRVIPDGGLFLVPGGAKVRKCN